jgi:hypothetical protein
VKKLLFIPIIALLTAALVGCGLMNNASEDRDLDGVNEVRDYDEIEFNDNAMDGWENEYNGNEMRDVLENPEGKVGDIEDDDYLYNRDTGDIAPGTGTPNGG